MAIWGSEKVIPKGGHWPRAADTYLLYGRPFHLPEALIDNQRAADHMMSKIAELLPEEYRGHYAPSRPAEAVSAG